MRKTIKSLSDYTQKHITKLLNTYGAFFAFTQKQFDEARKEGQKYVRFSTGMICPKENANILTTAMNAVYDQGIEQRKAEYTKEEIIDDAIWNYEAFYSDDYDRVIDDAKMYGFTEADVYEVRNANWDKYCEAL